MVGRQPHIGILETSSLSCTEHRFRKKDYSLRTHDYDSAKSRFESCMKIILENICKGFRAVGTVQQIKQQQKKSAFKCAGGIKMNPIKFMLP